ncbi:glycosyltransferase family 2 protein [Mycobacteroides abscessus subsp. massiliense]|uniref:glycosyltransferase family 2 protein n=1 Tax=Mycobacteroides abscessus TaxID=36809 RepID=UPI000F625723|nr:glycosyltransferase family A protein [Mycobacteroides abscessus]RRE02163.1 glycosyltransferase family 2 protein [Mycobacteroides abscessus subsp. massiliense]
MTSTPRTSFVIASRNRASELAAVAQRLLDTTEGPIVLVDNASGDDSVATMRRLQSHAQQRLTVVPLCNNLGAVARNIGVAHCDTEYVAFCDDDSWWEPKSIAAAESIFDLHPGVALLAARTIVLPGGYDDPLTYALAHSPLGRWPNLPGPSVLGFLACASIIRRSAFTAVGGFSPILHFRGEEQLMAWDLASKGWHLCYCDELVTYHQPSKLRPPGEEQRARALRNDTLSIWLRRPYRQCVRAGARLVRAALREPAHRRALWEAVQALPAVAAERRRLPDQVERALTAVDTDPDVNGSRH